jgi:PKD repeat protein
MPTTEDLCTDPKPAVTETCNPQSCSNIACTPVIQSLPPFSASPAAMIAISPTTGPAPLTVTLNQGILTNLPWDAIDFGDGTSFAPQDLVFQNLIGPNTGGAFACVNHTFIAPGTYSIGRNLAGGDPRFYPRQEVTVVVQ